MGHALVGTLWMVGIAVVLTVPVGLVAAVYLDVTRSRPARFFRTVVEAMTALPSILAGLFIYAVVDPRLRLRPLGPGRGARPQRDDAALHHPGRRPRPPPGARQPARGRRPPSGRPGWRGEMQVVIPTARSGLATAVILGIARAIGEASPVLLTAGFTSYINANPLNGPMVSLPLEALKLVQAGVPAYTTRAFGCASFLLVVVIVLFLVARKIGGWGPGHLSHRGQRRVRGGLGPRRRPVRRAARHRSARWRDQVSDANRTRPSESRLMADRVAAGASRLALAGHGCGAGALSCWPAPRPVPPATCPSPARAPRGRPTPSTSGSPTCSQTACGSTTRPTARPPGRQDCINGLTDFAASDIPFQTDPQDGSAPEHPQPGSYAYMPITAGGTVFMYNLKINGQQVTNLRLSGENIAKIFTGAITNWDNPAIAADNPALKLPNQTIVPVVRSDGAGSSYELSEWMISQYPSIVERLLPSRGRAPACGATSFYPTVAGLDDRPERRPRGGRLRLAELRRRFHRLRRTTPTPSTTTSRWPRCSTAAGYYTEPTAQNVAVSLLAAQVDTTDVNNPALYLTQNLQGRLHRP